jgi:hypothetical protein
MRRRYFSTEDPAETKLVKVTAIKRGTITGRAGTFHFDPKGKDPLARARSVRPEVAEEAVKKGLVTLAGNGSTRTDGSLRTTTVAANAASRRETSVTKEDERTDHAEFFGLAPANTRDTTAFEVDPSKVARVNPFEVQTLGDEQTDADDDDTDEDDDDGDDQGEGETDRMVSLDPADAVLSQEGNAGGADGPPIDDEDDTSGEGSGQDGVSQQSGSDQGSGESHTDGTGSATDATDTETKTVAAPRPRRTRSTTAA